MFEDSGIEGLWPRFRFRDLRQEAAFAGVPKRGPVEEGGPLILRRKSGLLRR